MIEDPNWTQCHCEVKQLGDEYKWKVVRTLDFRVCYNL